MPVQLDCVSPNQAYRSRSLGLFRHSSPRPLRLTAVNKVTPAHREVHSRESSFRFGRVCVRSCFRLSLSDLAVFLSPQTSESVSYSKFTASPVASPRAPSPDPPSEPFRGSTFLQETTLRQLIHPVQKPAFTCMHTSLLKQAARAAANSSECPLSGLSHLSIYLAETCD